MATHRISIVSPFGRPATNPGGVFWQPYSIIDSGAVLIPDVLCFKDSGTKDGYADSFHVPQNYVGSAVLRIVWTANATAGTCVFDWSVLPRSGAEDMGAAAARTTETDSTTKGGTAFTRETNDITLTDADYAAGDEVLF